MPTSLPCDGSSCTVFITSTQHAGALNGLDGADAICQEQARVAGLSGHFKAWLSDDADSPDTRFTHAPTPYVLVGGPEIASDWLDLTDGALARHIDLNEFGVAVSGFGIVWTRTASDGKAATLNGGPDCARWSTNSSLIFGVTGQRLGSLTLWSEFGLASCNAGLRLYCFQQ